jgi:hypothetical protein
MDYMFLCPQGDLNPCGVASEGEDPLLNMIAVFVQPGQRCRFFQTIRLTRFAVPGTQGQADGSDDQGHRGGRTAGSV